MANNFKNYFLKSAGTTAQNVFAAGTGVQATVIGLTIANLITTPISANIILNTGQQNGVGQGQNVYMVLNATIAPGGALVPIGGDQKLVLEAGDYLQVNTSVASSADVIVSVLEIS
jgi:hypothetical protein